MWVVCNTMHRLSYNNSWCKSSIEMRSRFGSRWLKRLLTEDRKFKCWVESRRKAQLFCKDMTWNHWSWECMCKRKNMARRVKPISKSRARLLAYINKIMDYWDSIIIHCAKQCLHQSKLEHNSTHQICYVPTERRDKVSHHWSSPQIRKNINHFMNPLK